MRDHSCFWNHHPSWRSLAIAALAAVGLAAGACAGVEPEDGDQDRIASCEAAGDELSTASCLAGQPVNDQGVAAEDLGVSPSDGGAVAKSHRTYYGACTNLFGGCSQVTAEGYTYTRCGPLLKAYMTFDGAWGNLTGWGIKACL